MRIGLLNRPNPGETVDPGMLNENFQHLAAAINGGLGADNLSRAYRLPEALIRRHLTPVPFTVTIAVQIGGLPLSLELCTAQIKMPQSISNGSALIYAYFSHADFSYFGVDGNIIPITQTAAPAVGQGCLLYVYRNAIAAGSLIWQTTYDSPLLPNTYVWGQGQQIKQAAGTDPDMSLAPADVLYVRAIANLTPATVISLRVRLWVYFPQAIIPATASNTPNSLTRQILPPQWK